MDEYYRGMVSEWNPCFTNNGRLRVGWLEKDTELVCGVCEEGDEVYEQARARLIPNTGIDVRRPPPTIHLYRSPLPFTPTIHPYLHPYHSPLTTAGWLLAAACASCSVAHRPSPETRQRPSA